MYKDQAVALQSVSPNIQMTASYAISSGHLAHFSSLLAKLNTHSSIARVDDVPPIHLPVFAAVLSAIAERVQGEDGDSSSIKEMPHDFAIALSEDLKQTLAQDMYGGLGNLANTWKSMYEVSLPKVLNIPELSLISCYMIFLCNKCTDYPHLSHWREAKAISPSLLSFDREVFQKMFQEYVRYNPNKSFLARYYQDIGVNKGLALNFYFKNITLYDVLHRYKNIELARLYARKEGHVSHDAIVKYLRENGATKVQLDRLSQKHEAVRNEMINARNASALLTNIPYSFSCELGDLLSCIDANKNMSPDDKKKCKEERIIYCDGVQLKIDRRYFVAIASAESLRSLIAHRMPLFSVDMRHLYIPNITMMIQQLFPQLKTLVLQDCYVTDLDASHLPATLTHLYIGDAQLKEVKNIASLKNLIHLEVIKNYKKDSTLEISAVELASLPHLTTIVVDDINTIIHQEGGFKKLFGYEQIDKHGERRDAAKYIQWKRKPHPHQNSSHDDPMAMQRRVLGYFNIQFQ